MPTKSCFRGMSGYAASSKSRSGRSCAYPLAACSQYQKVPIRAVYLFDSSISSGTEKSRIKRGVLVHASVPPAEDADIRSSFYNRAAAVGAGIVLAAFAARAGDHELLVVFRRSRQVLVPRIIAVRIHRFYAKDRVVSAERRGVCRGGPTPAY